MLVNVSKLLDLLSNNDLTFFIPPFQRNYDWDSENCEAFFRDVIKTYNRNHTSDYSEHFFGAITYYQEEAAFGEPSKLVLIDGQQRITTTMLFLVAIRDLVDDENIRDYIDSRYLRNSRMNDDQEYKIKLKQVKADWKAYCDVILGNEVDNKEKTSNIYQNYMLFRNLLEEYSHKIDLKDLIVSGVSKFYIITSELQPKIYKWENPQEIFESMNSLGKPLSLGDLVRNYLLLGLPSNEQEKLYDMYWLDMETRVPNISDYIRDFMQLKEEKACAKATDRNCKALYAEFKEVFETTNKPDLIKEMNTFSLYYSYIVSDQSTGNTTVDSQLKDIRYMSVTTSYSFLLSLLCSWKQGRINDQDIIDILKVLLTYFIRRRIIGLAAAENKNLPGLVRHVDQIEKADDKREYLFKILSEQESNMRIPNDFELERELQVMNFFNFRYAKFILSLVEESITKSRPELDDLQLQIEHIMPQTLGKEWIEELGSGYEEIHMELLNNIGNLTLIRHNQELGNKQFIQKKDIYDNKAGIQIARTEITNKEKWGKEEIKQREEWIISYILENVLPIPENMRRANNFSPKKTAAFSFEDIQLIDQYIYFYKDSSIRALVVSDKEVEFEGKKWKLAPLTREVSNRLGIGNKSGAYQGSKYWMYNGKFLSEY